MNIYIPKSMIKKTKSQARHNSEIRLGAEVAELVKQDVFDMENEFCNPMVDAIKSTVVTVAAIAVAWWWFYG